MFRKKDPDVPIVEAALEWQDERRDLFPAETMNSKVHLLDLETTEEMTYTLVFPEEADISQGKISVLAPIGTALLGYRAGDTISWEVPAGVRRIKILDILYQPEASGDYHL